MGYLGGIILEKRHLHHSETTAYVLFVSLYVCYVLCVFIPKCQAVIRILNGLSIGKEEIIVSYSR